MMKPSEKGFITKEHIATHTNLNPNTLILYKKLLNSSRNLIYVNKTLQQLIQLKVMLRNETISICGK